MSTQAVLCAAGLVCAIWRPDATSAVATSAVVAAKELSMAVVDPAVAIQKSLVADSTAGIRGNAETIEEAALKRLEPPSPEIAQAAKTLKAAGNLADARTAFGKLSEAIVAYVDAQKLTLDPRIHIAFCPMVNKPWLQAGDEIANPYFGKEMPTCGSIKK